MGKNIFLTYIIFFLFIRTIIYYRSIKSIIYETDIYPTPTIHLLLHPCVSPPPNLFLLVCFLAGQAWPPAKEGVEGVLLFFFSSNLGCLCNQTTYIRVGAKKHFLWGLYKLFLLIRLLYIIIYYCSIKLIIYETNIYGDPPLSPHPCTSPPSNFFVYVFLCIIVDSN